MNWQVSSLRKRLMLMLAGMAFAVLALALLIFTIAGTLRQQDSMMSQLRSLTRVVAANAEAAVVFGDEQAAAVNLASLREQPEVVAASISSRRRRREEAFQFMASPAWPRRP